MSDANDNVVYQFDRGENEVIRATLSEFNNVLRADLRVFYQDSEGEWRPTKKGINIPAEQLEELQKAVAALQAAGKERR